MMSMHDDEGGVDRCFFRRHDDCDGDAVDDLEDRDTYLTHRIPHASYSKGICNHRNGSPLACGGLCRMEVGFCTQRACQRLVARLAPPDVHYVSCVKLIQSHCHTLGSLFMSKEATPWRRVGCLTG